ncbi:MAG: N-acetylmuramidase domain-containing protein, partial [Caldilineaceae bacterium]
ENLYGEEYQQWLSEVFKYPYIGSASFFILSSPDKTWDSFAWRTGGSIKGGIVGRMARLERPELVPVQLGQPAGNGAQPPTPGAAPQVKVGDLPDIVTHQQLIDAFYKVADQLGLGNWDVLNKTGLNVEQLAQNRQALYKGLVLAALPNLSLVERGMLAAELVTQLRKAKKTTGVVNAPDGLNLRQGPGSDKSILETLGDQTPLDVVNEQGDWLFVATNANNAGYVHRNYVNRADAAPQAAAAVVTPPAAAPVVSGGVSKALAGFLASTPELIAAPLAGEQFVLGPNAGPGAKLLTNIWNRYGGLLSAVAAKLGIDPALAVAILAVESGGNAFGPDGRMIIRFENHLFYQYWGKQNQARFAQHFTYSGDRVWEGHTWRSDPNQPFQEFHGNQAAEWAALNFAASLDDTAAKYSISMGLPQIMGFNYQRIGYANVQDMFTAFQGDERNHVLGMFDFIKADPNMLQALRNNDYKAFASGYNGPGQAEYYGGLIQKWVQSFNILRQDPSSAAFGVEAAPTLTDDLDAAISFLPMPLPSAIFAQAQPAVNAIVPAAPVHGDTEAEQLPPIEEPAPVMDERLYNLWLKHIEHGFENNNIMFNRVLRAFMVPYYMTVAMYVVMFMVGIGLFVVAARLSSQQGTQLAGLFFGGLGIASFLGYFMSKPLRSLEENLQFITWLGIVYNTYWTRLLYMQNAVSVQDDLKEATSEAITQIEHMLNKNVEVAYKRPDAKEQG